MGKRNRPLPVAPRQQQQRTSNLTRIVDVAIRVGIDCQQDTPQHFIGIFKSYTATESVRRSRHQDQVTNWRWCSRWSIFFSPFFSPLRSRCPSLRISRVSQSLATLRSRSISDSLKAIFVWWRGLPRCSCYQASVILFSGKKGGRGSAVVKRTAMGEKYQEPRHSRGGWRNYAGCIEAKEVIFVPEKSRRHDLLCVGRG